jgi:trypsin
MAGKLALTVALAMPALTMGRTFDKPRFNLRDGKIVGGEPAKVGDFPFIVSLSSGGSHFCGGSLISEDTVVTAGHCSIFEPAEVQVRAGSLNWASGGQQVGVSEITVHPEYQSASSGFDVAVWKLSAPVQASNGTVGFATLPEAGFDPAEGSLATTAGWGDLEAGAGAGSPTLQKVEVPIVGREACQEQYAQYTITDTMICAAEAEGGQDSCQGDSGGPIVDEAGTLIGIVSWGIGCAEQGHPGVYSNVGALIDFINENA